jgi:hypothetical protein
MQMSILRAVLIVVGRSVGRSMDITHHPAARLSNEQIRDSGRFVSNLRQGVCYSDEPAQLGIRDQQHRMLQHRHTQLIARHEREHFFLATLAQFFAQDILQVGWQDAPLCQFGPVAFFRCSNACSVL